MTAAGLPVSATLRGRQAVGGFTDDTWQIHGQDVIDRLLPLCDPAPPRSTVAGLAALTFLAAIALARPQENAASPCN